MTDKLTKEGRSSLMSRIRSKDTKPERLVRRYLHSQGLRFRLHVKRLPGKPDIVLKRFKTVVLVHGCFWHGHQGCRHFALPKTRTDFWQAKIAANHSRDTLNSFRLARLGWRIFTVWECELSPKVRQETLAALYHRLLDPSGIPARPKKYPNTVIKKTIRFAPGADGATRSKRIRQVVQRMGRPVVDIRLLKKGFPPLQYGEQDAALADGTRILFAAEPEESYGEGRGTLGCTRCGVLLEECVWEAQDGLCGHCLRQAA